MKLFINPNEKRFIDVKNETISGVLISIDTDVDLSASMLALALDSISIVETIDGVKQANKEILSKASLLDVKNFIFPNASYFCSKTFQKSRALGVNPVFQLRLNFGTALNLKNGIGLFLECDNKSLGAGTTTQITIETIPVIGVQSFFPKYEVLELEPMRTEHDLNIGNNVSAIIYNGNGNENDPFDVLETTIFSDILATEMSDLMIYNQLQDSPQSPEQDYKGTPINLISSPVHVLNDVRLKLKFKNALGGRKLLIVRKIVDTAILTNLVQKNQEHQMENINKIRSAD